MNADLSSNVLFCAINSPKPEDIHLKKLTNIHISEEYFCIFTLKMT